MLHESRLFGAVGPGRVLRAVAGCRVFGRSERECRAPDHANGWRTGAALRTDNGARGTAGGVTRGA